jgi:hypothetical protein
MGSDGQKPDTQFAIGEFMFDIYVCIVLLGIMQFIQACIIFCLIKALNGIDREWTRFNAVRMGIAEVPEQRPGI